ncbi:hypothetical protein [Ruminococcus flavefaciens]|uniref:hypothetical protein n=1 Tax=Ruminococcus flavefaciens TaxID=1265 RepID=UPI0026E975BB|nr:hypothetical protein [Ruminococcus flavefaciens]
MIKKTISAVIFAAAIGLAFTAACTDNNTDDYVPFDATTETTTEETTTTAQPTTEATTAAKKEYPELVNTYSGTYVATQGLTALDLSVFGTDDDGDIQALFSFHEDPSNPGVPTGSYLMEGTVKESDKKDIIEFVFTGSEWEKHPETYHIIDFTAYFDVKKGTVTGDSYEFDLKKSSGADLTYLIGEFNGTYTPESGENTVKFTVEDIGDHGDIQAVFEYEPKKGEKACFISNGQVTNIAPDGRVTASFEGEDWIIEPDEKKFIDFDGVFAADGRSFTENGGHNIDLKK